jgi:hypothetical protein
MGRTYEAGTLIIEDPLDGNNVDLEVAEVLLHDIFCQI